jgi:predicted outer membrane repeat protein
MRAALALLLACAAGWTVTPAAAAAPPHAPMPAQRVVGTGTAASCTSAAVVAAVRRGGEISFSCGPRPVTIDMRHTAKVINTSPRVVLDGGGKVTLSGEHRRRILYMNTCDRAQVWITSHCEQQASPRLVVKGLTFENGISSHDGRTGGGAIYAFGGGLRIEYSAFADNRCARSSGPAAGGGAVSALWQDRTTSVEVTDSSFRANVCDNGGPGGGGGAIFATQNRLAIDRSTFDVNRCPRDGPDVGGAAVRAFIERGPVAVTDSDFRDNVCSNGAALSSIGASWTVRGSTFTDNHAIGIGANPARAGTPGGGSGGAIYNDGDRMTLSIADSSFRGNTAKEGGGAIFFVSDDRTGTMTIAHSTLVGNPNAGFHTSGLPGIFFLGAHRPTITHSLLRP